MRNGRADDVLLLRTEIARHSLWDQPCPVEKKKTVISDRVITTGDRQHHCHCINDSDDGACNSRVPLSLSLHHYQAIGDRYHHCRCLSLSAGRFWLESPISCNDLAKLMLMLIRRLGKADQRQYVVGQSLGEHDCT